VPCVGAVVRDEAGRLLLVRRAHPPAQGRWSLPGGRVELGESDEQALVREVHEETGLDVVVEQLVGTVEWDRPDRVRYLIRDYACAVRGGVLRAGDDASDARWVTDPQLRRLPTSAGLLDTLVSWGVARG
jgi:mutator protein MutT